MMFCGYPTYTHQGILETVENRATFANLNSLVWIGDNDRVIPPELTLETIPFFESPVVIESEVGGHEVPMRNDPTFGVVVSFMETGGEGVFDDFEVEIEVGSGNSTDTEDEDSEDYEEEKPEDWDSEDFDIGSDKSEDYDSEEYDIGKSEDWDSEEAYDKEEGDWGDKEEGDWSDWGDKEEGDWSDKEEGDWNDKEGGDWGKKEEGDWGDKEEAYSYDKEGGEGVDLIAGADSESMFLSSSGTTATTHSMAVLPFLGAFASLVAASLGW